MINKWTIVLISSLLIAYSHSGPDYIDDGNFSNHQSGISDVIGVTDQGDIAIEKTRTATEELLSQEMLIERLKDDLDHEAFELQRCREDLADPRLGGTGKYPSPIDVNKYDLELEEVRRFGLDSEENLIWKSSVSYKGKLKLMRQNEKTLNGLIRSISNIRKKCEWKMGKARVKNGLPFRRVQGNGYFDDNKNWIQTRPAEFSLDDVISSPRTLKK